MKAGLLICDHIDPPYQPEFGDYPEMFAKLFPEFDFVYYEVTQGQFPTDLNECDVFLATGSRYSVYEDIDWIKRLLELVREIYRQKKYFLGFCFGHQLIGYALGGKVEKSPNGWCIGAHTFEVRQKAPWMQPSPPSFNLLMLCQDQIAILPENTQVLAGDAKCPVGLIQVGENMLGIQGHPEFSKAYDRLMMERRIDRMGKDLVEEGIASLQKEVHTQLMHDWFLNFLGLPKSSDKHSEMSF